MKYLFIVLGWKKWRSQCSISALAIISNQECRRTTGLCPRPVIFEIRYVFGPCLRWEKVAPEQIQCETHPGTHQNKLGGIMFSRVHWFLKLIMRHVVLDRQKISKTILGKAFFFILWRFFLFGVFCVAKFEKRPF